MHAYILGSQPLRLVAPDKTLPKSITASICVLCFGHRECARLGDILVVMSAAPLPSLKYPFHFLSGALYRKLPNSNPIMSADDITKPAPVKRAAPHTPIFDEAELTSSNSWSSRLKRSPIFSASSTTSGESGRLPTQNYERTCHLNSIFIVNGCMLAIRVAWVCLSGGLVALFQKPIKWHENYQAARKVIEDHNQKLYAAIKSEPGESTAKSSSLGKVLQNGRTVRKVSSRLATTGSLSQ